MEPFRIVCRTLEPIARLLNQELQIPQIYLETSWPQLDGSSYTVDVLAVDRAGIGDVHIVEIKDDATEAFKAIPELMKIRAHYRWIAFYEESVTPDVKSRLSTKQELDPEQGAGRIGVIAVERSPEDKLSARIVVYAERFHGLKYSQVAEYLKGMEPDLYIRD